MSISQFEEVFGKGASHDTDILDLIVIIRDKFDAQINSYIPESSMASSPGCILYAIYKLLENDLKDKDFISYESQMFGGDEYDSRN